MLMLAWHVGFLPAAHARAQSLPAESPDLRAQDGAEDEDASRARALELFGESETAFRAGRFLDAADLLRQAYAVVPEPVLLYNLGKAYEAANASGQAADAYEGYLKAAPNVPDADRIRERVASLRARAESDATPPSTEVAKSASGGVPASTPAPVLEKPTRLPQAPLVAQPAERTHARSPASVVPWVLAGAGVTLLATSFTLNAVAQARHEQAVADEDASSAESKQTSAEELALAATVTGVGGGTLCVTGLGLLIFDLLMQNQAPRDPRGLSVVVGMNSAVLRVGY